MSAPVIVVAGALAAKPGNGGEAWVRLSWVRGLLRLGYDAWFVEELPDPSAAATQWFARVTHAFGIADRSILVHGARGALERDWTTTHAEVGDVLRASTLLVNISGNLRSPSLLGLPARRAYVDLDPGFTQIWAVDGTGDLGLDRHELHFSVGELVGTLRCPIPSAGFRWLPCRQPVVLDDWPVTPLPPEPRLTTVATWRCTFGPVAWAGINYGLKLHELRSMIDLPSRTAATLEMALDIHPADQRDRNDLVARGWSLTDPATACADPETFRAYVQGSTGEFSVAQGVYARACTGWFSDRTARYLASGRPAVVQDTGWADGIDRAGGLLTFDGVDEAVAAVEAVWSDPVHHARQARVVAERYFDSDVVLSQFLAAADDERRSG